MNRRVGLLSLILAASFALPAAAQVRKRDHRKKKDQDQEVVKARRGGKKGVDPIKVTGFRPQSGSVGTLVTIDGDGFDKKTQLLLGGKRLRPRSQSDRTITFEVPKRWGDGTIVLRHPDMADDVVVGTFEVVADPVIRSFAPVAGVPGTRVELRGTGFRKGDQVLMNNRTLSVSSLAENRIVATIPDNATTDYLVVSRPGGVQARSAKEFRVVQPAPTISSLTPPRGPAGTKVRINGTNFTQRDSVFYGRREVATTGASHDWIDFVVPENARNDQFITVRGQWGTATSAQRFELERLPSIASFTPRYGVVGQRVEIYGSNFAPRDRVTLGGRAVRILQLRPKQISVEVPNGANSGQFVIERGRTQIASSDVFDVVSMPEVTGFSPSGGDVGTRVTITGRNFSGDTEVLFGRQKLRLLQSSGSALVVQIPRGATDQFFTVRTRGGEASSPTRFEVYSYSVVTGVNPSSGPVGTRVLITGSNFGRGDRFFLGRTELPVEERRRDKVWVTIPEGASSARLSWDSYGRQTDSRWSFTVLEPPRFANYGPHAGPPGTEITINGDHFTGSTRVLWGNQELRIVRRQLPSRLVALIPNDAAGTKYVWVVDAGARVRSGQAFQVVSPPAITSFSPTWGPPGTEVSIAGDNFSKTSTVRIGRTAVDIVRWTPTSLVVRLPRDLPAGKDYFWVDDDRASQRARTPFEITGFATITRFKPARAKPGQRIEIFGTNFSPTTKVFYGKYECEVVKVDKRGRKMQVILSPDANGKGYLWAEDYGERAQSPDTLEVIGGENERDRRKSPRDKKKRRGRDR